MNYKFFFIHPHIYIFMFFISIIGLQGQEYKKLYTLAIDAFDNKQDSLAYVYISKAIEQHPKYYDALYARAYYLMSDGIYDLASDDYDVLITLQPENAELFYYRANAYFYLNNFARAEENYLRAYELEKKDIDIIDGLITLYYTLDLYEDAQFYIQKSLELNSQNPKTFYHSASVNLALKKYRLALTEIDKALKIKENDPEFLRLKAKIYVGYKKFTKAIEIYEQFEDLYPNDLIVEDFLYWSESLYKIKKYKTAEYYLLTPQYHENSDIYYLLARVKYSQYQNQNCLAYLDTTLQYADKYAESSSEIFYNRAYVRYKQRMPQEGQKDYFWSLYLMPEIFEQKNYTGEKLALLGNCNIAYRAETQKAMIDSIRLKGFQDRCQVFLNEGDTQKALLELVKAQQIDSLNVNNFILKATCYTFMDKNKEAIQVLDTALFLAQKTLDKTEIFYTQSLIYAELENYSKALVSIEEALKLDKTKAGFYAQKASMLSELEKTEEAIQYINQAITLDKNIGIFYTERALYQIQSKNLKEGLGDANKALEIDDSDILAYYARGLAQMKLKNYKEAIKDFELVLDIFPEDGEVQNLYQKCQANLE